MEKKMEAIIVYEGHIGVILGNGKEHGSYYSILLWPRQRGLLGTIWVTTVHLHARNESLGGHGLCNFTQTLFFR